MALIALIMTAPSNAEVIATEETDDLTVIEIENISESDVVQDIQVMSEEVTIEAVEPEEPAEIVEYDKAKLDFFLKNRAARIAADHVVIGAIKKQNIKHQNLTQGDIDRLDLEWRAGDESLIKPVMDNVLSHRLKRFVEKYQGVYTEFFVIDNKGLNVGQSFDTSDYWQGDEDKFIKSYNFGKGDIFIDKAEYDASTGHVQISASLPVYDYDGKVIGAIAMGINPSKIR